MSLMDQRVALKCEYCRNVEWPKTWLTPGVKTELPINGLLAEQVRNNQTNYSANSNYMQNWHSIKDSTFNTFSFDFFSTLSNVQRKTSTIRVC